VTAALIDDCRYYLLNTKGLDPATVNLYVGSISPAFKYAASDALPWISTNPFTKITKLKEKPGRAPQLTDQQVHDLLEWVDKSPSKHLWLYVRLLLCSGARNKEALRLKWGQVNVQRGTVTFIKTKSRKQRTIPLPSFMVDMLKEVYENRFRNSADVFPDELYLFPSPKHPNKPMVSLHLAYGKARAKAGLSHIRFHDLRHHYASRMILDGGSDILAVSVLLGHANVKETQRYAHLTHSHVAAQVEAMGNAMVQVQKQR
jgi:integrase